MKMRIKCKNRWIQRSQQHFNHRRQHRYHLQLFQTNPTTSQMVNIIFLSLSNIFVVSYLGILESFVSVSDYSFTNALSYCLINCPFEWNLFRIGVLLCPMSCIFLILQRICVGQSPALSLNEMAYWLWLAAILYINGDLIRLSSNVRINK